MNARVAKLVTFGLGGDVVELGGYGTISGYGSPESPHAAKPGDDLIIPDGTYAIDKRGAVETDEGYRWVFRGPMCNPDLPDGDCDTCPEPDPIMAAAITFEPSNQFGQLLTLHEVSKAAKVKRGPLDAVSVSEYVQGWREHGARIGRYQGNAIVWD